jgi:hypothetical protein
MKENMKTINHKEYQYLSRANKLAVLRDINNANRLNVARQGNGVAQLLHTMDDDMLLRIGDFYFADSARYKSEYVLHCPALEVEVDRMPFSVKAGKIETGDDGEDERNYKYIEDFQHLEQAVAAAETCQGYHFVDLTYTDPLGRHFNLILEAL